MHDHDHQCECGGQCQHEHHHEKGGEDRKIAHASEQSMARDFASSNLTITHSELDSDKEKHECACGGQCGCCDEDTE